MEVQRAIHQRKVIKLKINHYLNQNLGIILKVAEQNINPDHREVVKDIHQKEVRRARVNHIHHLPDLKVKAILVPLQEVAQARVILQEVTQVQVVNQADLEVLVEVVEAGEDNNEKNNCIDFCFNHIC